MSGVFGFPATRVLRDEVLLGPGFLGTAAPRYADLVLLIEAAMGLGLLVGAFLARKRKYRWHACCQSIVVLLNLLVIFLVMTPSFAGRVLLKIPAKLGKVPYLLPTAHGAMGTVAEVGALYILVAAGTNILPTRFRLKNYKLWMRGTLVLWWLVILLGVASYVDWYTPFLKQHH